MELTENDINGQTESKVHLDTWLRRYEWEELLENQRLRELIDEKMKEFDDITGHVFLNHDQQIEFNLLQSLLRKTKMEF